MFFFFSIVLFQLPILIHELLAVELWKENVFPRILQSGYKPHTTLPVYFVVGAFSLFELISWFCENFGSQEIMTQSDYVNIADLWLISSFQ